MTQAPSSPRADQAGASPLREGAAARCTMVSRGGGVLAAAVALLVLVGWVFDMPQLTSVVPGNVPMKPGAALSFLLLAVALVGSGQPAATTPAWPWLHWGARAAAALVLVYTGLASLEHVVDSLVGAQEGWPRQALAAIGVPHASRPAMLTAIGLAMLAGGLVLLGKPGTRGHHIAQAFALATILLGGVALLGYLYEVELLYATESSSTVSLPSAALFVLLGVAALCARPSHGPVATLTADTSGGIMARRLLPAVVGLPVVLGALVVDGVQRRGYPTQIALAMFTASVVVLFVAVVWLNASQLNHFDRLRRRTAFEVEAREEQLRLAVTGAHIGTWHWDLASGHRVWSDECRSLFGLDRHEPIEEGTAQGLVHPSDRPAFDAAIAAALARPGEFSIEFRVTHPNRGERWLLAQGRSSGDGDGKPLRLEGVVQDITERRQLTEELRESELRLSTLVSAAMDAIITLDGDFNIIQFNRSAERMFGHRAADLVGGPLDVLLPANLRDTHRHLVRTFGEGDDDSRRMGSARSVRGVRAGGEEFPIEASISKVELSGRRYYTAILRDITERELAQAALTQAKDELEHKVRERTAQLQAAKELAELADQHKTRFLGLMSHELRTPLNAIIGFTGTLLMRLKGPLNAEQERQMKTIQSSAQHLLALIGDVLDVTRIDSGDMALVREPVEIQTVLREAADASRPLAENRGLSLTVDAPAAPITARVDRRTLRQIVSNLASNAIKFTERGGVTIRLRQHRRDNELCTEIDVEDTGIGIRPEDLGKLFQAFSQIDSSNTRRFEGTGLGLYLSQRLAGLLGGRLTCTSRHGEGSCFTLSLLDGCHRAPVDSRR